MASLFRRSKKKFAQSKAAQQCASDEIATEDWEDYVLVTVESKAEQPVNKHRVYSLESSLDSGYEEIHMPPPATEEDTAVGGAGFICSEEAKKQNTEEEERPACRTDRDLGLHHSFFGQRFYKYDDTECEGNRYITNDEL